VIDTQLILRATLNQRSLPAKILFDLGERYTLAIAPAMRAEAEDVLNRPKLRAKFSGLTDTAVARTLVVLTNGLVVTPEEVPSVARDPKDDIFLACAVAAKAQYIVTEDKDLLVLHPYEGIQIIDAEAFLRILQPPADVESQQQKGTDDD
jgi:putative PIN family toxin of toxin-antitoxin system